MVLGELKKMVKDSAILEQDDEKWPEPDRVGRQELEIISGKEHISFTTGKTQPLTQIRRRALRETGVNTD